MPHPRRLTAKNRMNAATRVMTSDLGPGPWSQDQGHGYWRAEALGGHYDSGSHLSGHCGGVGGVGDGDRCRRRTTLQLPEGVISFNLGSGMVDMGCVPMGKLPSRHSVHACCVSQGSAMGETQLSVSAQLTVLVKGARRQRDSRSERHEFLSRLAVCGRTTLLLLVIVAAAGQGLRGRRRNAPNQRRRCTPMKHTL
jgi:hypothetical protein